MTQEQKLALRLKDLLSKPGLHVIQVMITPDLLCEFWTVDTKKVEGLQEGENSV